MSYDWTYNDECKSWNIHADGAWLSIAPRPHYCDRGRYIAVVTGLGDLDRADEFPRYFMDLERAKAEMSDWLAWRLSVRERGTAYHVWNARSMLVTEFGLLVQALQDHGIATFPEVEHLKQTWHVLSNRVGAEGSGT